MIIFVGGGGVVLSTSIVICSQRSNQLVIGMDQTAKKLALGDQLQVSEDFPPDGPGLDELGRGLFVVRGALGPGQPNQRVLQGDGRREGIADDKPDLGVPPCSC